MIKKHREYPVELKMREAILRRLPQNHPKRREILQDFKKIRAGYKGERELDYHLQFLPENDYYVFQNLRLPLENNFFQMDTLILSPFYALIIESKNIYGTLYFDPLTKQLIRTFDDQREGFPDPLLQAKRQEFQFQKWVVSHQMKPFPVHYLVAIGHPGTIVDTPRDNYHIFEKILHAEHIPDEIMKLSQKYSSRNLSPYLLKKLSELLISQHTLPQNNVLNHYHLHQTDFIEGIPCPHCSHSPMKRIHSSWHCETCQITSKNAHEQVIWDHLLLFHRITNEECRSLLKLSSIHTAKRILYGMNLLPHGKYKGRYYTMK